MYEYLLVFLLTCPMAPMETDMNLIAPQIRFDEWGSGHFSSDRGDRKHSGVDILCKPGSVILATVAGKVTRAKGTVYTDDPSFKYVEITDKRGRRVRVFYVRATIKYGTKVRAGDPIGISQTLQARYPGSDDHVHLEVIKNGKHVNPLKELKLSTTPGKGKVRF